MRVWAEEGIADIVFTKIAGYLTAKSSGLSNNGFTQVLQHLTLLFPLTICDVIATPELLQSL